MTANIQILDDYYENIEPELRSYFFNSLTSLSGWDDTIWFFDRLVRSPGHNDGQYKIWFSNIPEQYIEVVRYWVLFRMRNGCSVRTSSNGVTMLVRFLQFLIKECGTPEFAEIDRLTIEAYEDYLLETTEISSSSKEHSWTAVNNLFRDMLTWPQMPKATPVASGNPFNRTELDRKHSSRMIPDSVLDQLDNIYRDERLPIEDRVIYWILRCIPTRVSEGCSIRLNCLRPYSYNNRKGYILTIPDYKQSANQHRPKKKLIHILDEGHGKFLLDLIREQQEIAERAQRYLPEESRGYLMVSPRLRYLKSMLVGGRAAARKHEILHPFILTGPLVLNRMKKTARRFTVINPDGKPYNPISHCFRHCGITERLYEGFSYVEIRDMSGHEGSQMLTTSYAHVKDEEIKARAKKSREKGIQGPPVLFQGRIMNMTEEKEAKLLKTPRAYRIGDLGICSDLTSCSSDLFECLDCDYLVPDADNEEYYMAEVEKWSERLVQHTKRGNRPLAEQAAHMVDLHEKQLDRIRLSLEMLKTEDEEGTCGC